MGPQFLRAERIIQYNFPFCCKTRRVGQSSCHTDPSLGKRRVVGVLSFSGCRGAERVTNRLLESARTLYRAGAAWKTPSPKTTNPSSIRRRPVCPARPVEGQGRRSPVHKIVRPSVVPTRSEAIRIHVSARRRGKREDMILPVVEERDRISGRVRMFRLPEHTDSSLRLNMPRGLVSRRQRLRAGVIVALRTGRGRRSAFPSGYR